LPGWWSKLEIFDLTETPVLYFDLDTIVLKPFKLPKINRNEIYMLQPFKAIRGKWLSGCMYFKGNLAFLLDDFLKEKAHYQAKYKQEGDQKYIADKLKERGITPKPFNDFAKVQSYKWQALSGPDNDTNIVCFHGKPRPHEVEKGWITEIWTK
jgi:hypothetical protein